MSKKRLNLNRRNLLKSTAIAGVSVTGLTGLAAAKKRYPEVTDYGIFGGHSLNTYAIETANQPHHDRIAFTTTAFGDGYELYLADGVSSADDVPETVFRITDGALFVFGPEWLKGNRLQYQQDFTKLVRKVPLSNKEFAPTVVDKNVFRGEE